MARTTSIRKSRSPPGKRRSPSPGRRRTPSPRQNFGHRRSPFFYTHKMQPHSAGAFDKPEYRRQARAKSPRSLKGRAAGERLRVRY